MYQTGKSVSRRKETKNLSKEETLGNKKAILAALAKASEDSLFLQETTSTFDGEPQDYYILSRDQMAALVSGNMGIIESWISNMDRNHATRLLSRLIKERW
jgi:hypothetical protein